VKTRRTRIRKSAARSNDTARIAGLLSRVINLTVPDVGGSGTASGTVPVWAEPFHKTWLENEGCEFVTRLARAQAAELAAAVPFIKPGELVIGWDRLLPIVTAREQPFGNCIRLNIPRADELKKQHPERTVEIDGIVTYWQGWLAGNPDRRGPTCHASLAHERVIDLGIDGLRNYVARWKKLNGAARPECLPWYDAILTTLEGVSGFISAHGHAAETAAARPENIAHRAELKRIARICLHIAHGRPRSFHEAVQLFYLMFLVCGHDSPGPVDRYLWPALKRDLKNRTTTLKQAQELVDCLWLKFAEKTAYGATIGGQLRNGKDAVNKLSFLCLNSISKLRLLSPRTTLRWHRGLSRKFFDRAVEVVSEGCSFPSFVNDESVIPSEVERGTRLEDAREYTFVGCGQVFPHGRGHGNYEDSVVNAVKAVEYALHNGVDVISGQQKGPQTGEPVTFATYEQFENAVHEQLRTMVGRDIQYINNLRNTVKGRAFDFLRSLLTWSCVERGLDWHGGGVDYSEGMVDLVGLTTVADSLTAVKFGVYQDGMVSLPDLVGILDRNWEQADVLYQYFRHRCPKFGNGDANADGMMEDVADRINRFVKSHRTAFGGPWGIDIIGWSGAVMFGEQTAATPDGRRRGEPLADCAGPAQGRNTEGVTQTLQSVWRLPHREAHGPLALSLRFPKSAVHGPEGRARLGSIIETYFRGDEHVTPELQRVGGQQLQISIASSEDMKAAQKNPEAWQSLMVRVGGFSAYFVHLDKRWQDDMIARSEMELG